MKNITPDLQTHLDEGTTTPRLVLADCTRADGVTFGFTDHDRTLSFDGTDFEPESGSTASEVRSGSDLSVDAQDAEGVLTSDRITETDILDGRWDNAEVEVWRVNWAETSQRVLMRRGAIGQIRRGRLGLRGRGPLARSCAWARQWDGPSRRPAMPHSAMPVAASIWRTPRSGARVASSISCATGPSQPQGSAVFRLRLVHLRHRRMDKRHERRAARRDHRT